MEGMTLYAFFKHLQKSKDNKDGRSTNKTHWQSSSQTKASSDRTSVHSPKLGAVWSKYWCVWSEVDQVQSNEWICLTSAHIRCMFQLFHFGWKLHVTYFVFREKKKKLTLFQVPGLENTTLYPLLLYKKNEITHCSYYYLLPSS